MSNQKHQQAADSIDTNLAQNYSLVGILEMKVKNLIRSLHECMNHQYARAAGQLLPGCTGSLLSADLVTLFSLTEPVIASSVEGCAVALTIGGSGDAVVGTGTLGGAVVSGLAGGVVTLTLTSVTVQQCYEYSTQKPDLKQPL